MDSNKKQDSFSERHGKFGGTTTDFAGNDLSGSKNYTVGVLPESAKHFTSPPTDQDHADFMQQHQDIVGHHANAAVGSSYDPKSGLHTLEVVGITPNKYSATDLAKKMGESSIFHLGRMESVLTGHEGERPLIAHSIDERFQELKNATPAKEPFAGTHYSDAKLDVIDGNRRGLSGGGEEAKRLRAPVNAVPGFYAYKEGSLPNASDLLKKNSYPVKGHFALADISSHPVAKAAFHGSMDASGGNDLHSALNSAEHALLDHGFDGYFSSQHPGTVFLFGSHGLKP